MLFSFSASHIPHPELADILGIKWQAQLSGFSSPLGSYATILLYVISSILPSENLHAFFPSFHSLLLMELSSSLSLEMKLLITFFFLSLVGS